jgi:hypothetical protein
MDSHIDGMLFHIKTTLNIDDRTFVELQRYAAAHGQTMSEVVETALRQLLRRRTVSGGLPPLPSFASGGALVDVADREALYGAMEGR